MEEEREKGTLRFKEMLADIAGMNEASKWKDIKERIKKDQRYIMVKSSKVREKLFEEYMMERVLITPGQKRQRLIEKGVAEDNDEVVKLDKSERKRVKKEENEVIEEAKRQIKEKVTDVAVSVLVRNLTICS